MTPIRVAEGGKECASAGTVGTQQIVPVRPIVPVRQALAWRTAERMIADWKNIAG